MQPRPEAKAAAHWWAEAMKSPKQDAGDINLNSVIQVFGVRTELYPEQLTAFEVALALKIEEKLASCTWDVDNPTLGGYYRVIGVDYHPDRILIEAAEFVGIKVRYCSTFPIKTNMWINPGCVTVGCGYRSPAVQIYPPEVSNAA